MIRFTNHAYLLPERLAGRPVAAFFLVLVLAVACSPANECDRTPTQATLIDHTADVETVIQHERELWEAWKMRELATIERLTAEDYYSVDERGPEQAIGLAEIRESFAKYELRDYRLEDVAVRRLAPGVIAVVYNARIDGVYDGEDISRDVSEASIWVRRDGKWLNVFLHEVTRAH
jgi:hypothetical protein